MENGELNLVEEEERMDGKGAMRTLANGVGRVEEEAARGRWSIMGVGRRKEKEKGEKGASVLHVVSQVTRLGIALRGREHGKEADRREKERERTAHGPADSVDIAMCVASGGIQRSIAHGGRG